MEDLKIDAKQAVRGPGDGTARRKLELAFERGFGFVADIERHLQRTLIGRLEQPRCKLQTPLHLIVEGLGYVKSGT